MTAHRLDEMSGGPPSYQVLRSLPLAGRQRSLGVNRHRNRLPTNPQKVWERYAGCLVSRGTGVYHDWRGRAWPVGPGSFVHHFPGLHHHIERSSAWEEHSLLLDRGLFDLLYALGVIDTGRPVAQVGGGSELRERFSRLRAGLEGGADPGAVVLAAAGLLQLVRELDARQAGPPADPVVAAARSRLADDLAAPLDLPALAAGSGLSYAQFRRRFRAEVGLAPGAFRNAQRLEQAALLLAHRRMPVAAVAAAVGYQDPFLFSRRFRQRFGCSPLRYHRSHFAE